MTNQSHIGYSSGCQVCGSTPLLTVLSLGHQAPVHAHLRPEKLHDPEMNFPLNLNRCTQCGLLQLDYIVDPKILFYPEYPYFSGMTTMLIRSFRELRDRVMERYKVKPQSLVIDVGSNDGTLLDGFKERGFKVLGVEPTNVAQVAQDKGVATMQEFFTNSTVEKILVAHGQASVVTATNMFAHVNNPFELARGIYDILSDDGVFVSESQYLLDMIEKSALDTIYHEHLRYYSIKPLQALLARAGLTVVDVERIDAAGGSIRVYAQKGSRAPSRQVTEMIQKETEAGIYDGSAFKNFSDRMIEAKRKLLSLMLKCRAEGARIVGIGAPGRSNTLLNFMHIDGHFLDYAVEKSGSPKIGLYTPGMHIPIVDENRLFQDQPEYGLLLSWHIADELMKKLRDLGFHGKFIVPLPEPKILNV